MTQSYRPALSRWTSCFIRPLICGAGIFVPASSLVRAAEPTAKPDIILILADDLGFSDIGSQGGEIKTPNIDRLAAEGARFTQASTTARCCPSRACLMTGAYAHRVGHGWMTEIDQGRPAYRGDLSADSVTVPEVLAGAGYRTYMSGKWHLTAEKDSLRLPASASWPTRRGFQEYFGIMSGGDSYVRPTFLARNETEIQPGPNFEMTEAITDAAVEFINAPLSQPRFVYVAYTAPHWPLHADAKEVERNLATYSAGYNRIAQARLKRLRELGLLTGNAQPADISTMGWDKLSPNVKADQARRMSVYAAQIQDMDRGVGRILDAIAKSGRAQNTVILFASDNGSCAEVLEAPPLPNNLSDSLRSTYGKAWASVSSLPFRGYKAEPTQGGLATPFFVHWPGKIRAGQRIDMPVHLIDVLPTFAAIAGATVPAEREGQPTVLPDGISLLPALAGKPTPARDLYFEHEGGRAVRRGWLKALAVGGSKTWQLYDLKTDPAELRNLASQRPAELKSLQDSWQKWATSNNVLPLDSRGWMERLENPEGWKMQ